MFDFAFKTFGPQGWGTYRLDPTHPTGLKLVDELTREIVCPGFVDLHIHGAFGADFMESSGDDLVAMLDKLETCGYESLLATTVTASADAVIEALGRWPRHPILEGFHLEGPFLSTHFPGAQPPVWITSPLARSKAWDKVLSDPWLKRITLAPETNGAHVLISSLFERGTQVSMGHTNATFSEAREGYEAGVRHSTHTFNAMKPFHHREAGAVGYILSQPEIFAELIYDRHHVCRDAAEVLFRSRPLTQVVAVSDATKAAGMPDGPLEMWSQPAEVKAGVVRLLDGTLAGSAATLDVCFRNLWADFGPEVAIATCCVNPRSILLPNTRPKKWLRLDSVGSVTDTMTC